jgi:UPF0716 protein FxsA
MPAAKWLVLIVVAWPFAELVIFIAVAVAVGFGPAVGLSLLTSVLGVLVLRYGGGAHIQRFRASLNQAGMSGLSTDAAGSFTVVAGILLLLPGFIGDVLGLLLLIPMVQRWLGARLRRAFGGNTPPTQPGTVDLAPDQWRRVPEARIEDRHEDGHEH